MKTRKLISVLLIIACVIPLACCATTVSGVTSRLVFDNANSLSSLNNIRNADVTFVATEKAIRVRATGTAPEFSFAPGTGSSYGYAVVTYRVDPMNSTAAFEGTLSVTNSGGSALASGSICYVKGYKAYSAVVDVAAAKSFDAVRFTVFDKCSAGDYAYIYGIEFASSMAEAKVLAEENALAANGDVISKYTEAELKTNAYSWEDYMVPYWDTGLITNEAIYPLQNSNGTLPDYNLMYSADRIVSVRDSTLKTDYKEGVDYELVNGKLRILKSGSIPTVKYTDHYFTTQRSNSYRIRNTNPTRYVRFQEGSGIPSVQIAVTYTHSDTWNGYLPEHQGESLPNTLSKLENGKNLKIVFFGDSITNGGNSSGEINMSPYAERWTVMFERELKRLYPTAAITCANTSVSGGSWTPEAVDNVQGSIINENPDLVILALGTNDYQFQYSASSTYNSMSYVVDSIKSAKPNCEIILVAPMLSNPECFDPDLLDEYIAGYRRKAAEYSGVVIADVNAVHKYLLTMKNYTDLSANNLCHLNDTLARTYGHVLIRTVTPSSLDAKYKQTALSRISGLIDRSQYSNTALETIDAILDSARAAVNSASTFDAAESAIREAKLKTALILKKTDEYKSAVDYENIYFNTEESLGLLSSTSYMKSTFNSDVGAVALSSNSNNADMRTTIVFPATKPVSATKDRYVVLTYMIASATSGENAQLFLCSGDILSPAEASSVRFSVKKTGSFVSEIIDLSNASWWSNRVTRIRIDPFSVSAKGDTMFIYSLSLCESASKAESVAARNEGLANGTAGAMNIVKYVGAASVGTIGAPTITHYVGDVNFDTHVSLEDISNAKKYLSGSNDVVRDPVTYDVNRDSMINLSDLSALKALVAGVGSSVEIVADCTHASVTATGSSASITPAFGHFVVFTAEGASARYAVLTYSSDKTFAAEYRGGSDVTGDADGVATFAGTGSESFVILTLPENTDSLTLDVYNAHFEVTSFALFELAEDAARYVESLN